HGLVPVVPVGKAQKQSMLYIDNQRLYSLQALLNAIMTNINMLAQNAATMGASMADMVANMPKEVFI
ncbi:hypothetical protein NE473_32165, partial [Hungatella sp. SL.1.14]|nr:hypothetical protein [Hungatella sp. SL.1.14]